MLQRPESVVKLCSFHDYKLEIHICTLCTVYRPGKEAPNVNNVNTDNNMSEKENTPLQLDLEEIDDGGEDGVVEVIGPGSRLDYFLFPSTSISTRRH